MMCPKCGHHAHRSHSRHFGETVVKALSSFKTYRCSECGWRGMRAAGNKVSASDVWRTALIWIAGIVTALIIGLYAAKYLAS